MNAVPPNRVIVPQNGKRDLVVAVIAGLLVMALVVYGILNLGSGATGSSVSGRIIQKTAVPQEEKQITIGAGGLRSREQSGVYSIQVKSDADGEIYDVWLDEETFNRLQVGEAYQIPKASLLPE